MPAAVRAIFVAILLTALPVAAGVWVAGDESEDPPTGPAPYASTPLKDYDTSTVTIARAGFCERVAPDAVTEALGTEATDEESYGNGDPTELVPREVDVAHEYGCTYVAADGAEARAWVFAPPVTADRAGELVQAAEGTAGCERQTGTEAYGAPSVALVCDYRERRFATYRGLFGDAWLSCSLGLPGTPVDRELLDRTGRWCVAVAQAAATS